MRRAFHLAEHLLPPHHRRYPTSRSVRGSLCGHAAPITTFTLKSPAVPVTLPDGLSEAELLAFAPFNDWLRTLTRSLSRQRAAAGHPFAADPYALRGIAVQSYDWFGGRGGARRLGFVKLAADVANGAGEALAGGVLLRGPSVAVLVVLAPDDGGDERYAVLTVQPRVAAGCLAFAELPAGMLDGGGSGSGELAGAAAREMREELGLAIPAADLRCLTDMALAAATAADDDDDDDGSAPEHEHEHERLPPAVYPSPGACDEYVAIYAHERRVPRAQLREWAGRLTGRRDEGERITLRLVPLRDLWREGARDAKCLAALALWEGLRREGRV
ncbi:hypothetical protein GGS23DRAFT_612595 [Durotheca rogersii]|uniref:uncharacterized protein n=1 Tax=Durotheca rogersii TaxID=419775 RepID=UPI00221ECFF7|nr:uncharacterized protein GGS23DRAFT_612595 [Durotheca rogersii]KAI5867477.1 hypothetical protein GGS23DRAFT_612595 [Durotheca rogersii]